MSLLFKACDIVAIVVPCLIGSELENIHWVVIIVLLFVFSFFPFPLFFSFFPLCSVVNGVGRIVARYDEIRAREVVEDAIP